MHLRRLINVAYAAFTEAMDSDALKAWHADKEPGPGKPGGIPEARVNPANRNVAALMAVSKSMARK